MKLSQDAIEEFKAIYQEEFGETLSDGEAQEMGGRLLRLFQILCRPLPSESHNPQHSSILPVDDTSGTGNMSTHLL